MNRLTCLAALAFMALFALASERAHAQSDFRALDGITAGSGASDMAVTPDDRFVLAVDRAGDKLQVVDSWNFQAFTSVDIAEGAPSSVAVSPDGRFAYVGTDTGFVGIVFLEPLYGTLPGESPPSLDVKYPDITGDNSTDIFDIAAIPSTNPGSTATFLLMATADKLYWARHTGEDQVESITQWSTTYKPLSVVSGASYGYELFLQSSRYQLRVISCTDLSQVYCDVFDPVYSEVDLGTIPFSGLAADPIEDNYLLTMNTSAPELWLLAPILDPQYPQTSLVGTTIGSTVVSDMALLADVAGGGDMVFHAHGDTATINKVERSSLGFTGSSFDIGIGEDLESLAASSGGDGYVYAGGSSDKIYPLTANPKVSGLSVNNDSQVTEQSGETVSVTFKVDPPASGDFTYKVVNDASFGEWVDVLAEGDMSAGDTLADPFIFASDLDECTNIITVLVTDEEDRTGRNAVSIYVNLIPPPEQSFDLSSGHQRIRVSFTAMDLCDLDRFEICYGTSEPSDITSVCGSTAYPSISISGPSAGEKIEKTIKGLENGVEYYFWVITYDEGDKSSVSGPESAVPQPISTLTDLVGEEGGVDCSVSGSGRGDPRGLAWLLVPAFLVLGSRFWRRRP